MTQAPLTSVLEPPQTSERVLGDHALKLTVTLPQFAEHSAGARRITRYYQELARQWQNRWETVLLPRAEARADCSHPWTATFSYQITLDTPHCLSLFWEVSEDTGERRPRSVRQGDIWTLPQGTPLSPTELFAPLGRHWRKAVIEEVESQIQARMKSGDCMFFEHRAEPLRRFLKNESFFLTEQGISLFYPVNTVAPAFEGFPVFLLPFPLPPALGIFERN